MNSIFDDRQISVLLVDDHELVRAGIKKLIMFSKRINVVAEAANGHDALELVPHYLPDVILLDILMPKMNGIDAAVDIKKNFPSTRIIFLTAYEDSRHIESALNAGADGYLTKDVSSKDLIDAVYKVMNGERVFSNNILQLMNNKYSDSYDNNVNVAVTAREQEILNYIAKGLTSPEIAGILHISVRTVQSHRSNIMQKLGIKSSAGLIRYAVLTGDN